MKFSDIAAVSGKGVLYRVEQKMRKGVILESMDEQKKKLVATARTKVSLLSEITLYTTSSKGSIPLIDVMKNIYNKYKGDIGIEKKSSPEKLKSFLKEVLPDYDEAKVYISHIKKLVSWYIQIVAVAPEVLKESEEKSKEEISN